MFPVKQWSVQVSHRNFRFVSSMVQQPEAWPSKAICWSPPLTNPQARRSRGRPPRRWDDDLIAFASVQFLARIGTKLPAIRPGGSLMSKRIWIVFPPEWFCLANDQASPDAHANGFCCPWRSLRDTQDSHIRFADRVVDLTGLIVS